MQPIIYDVAVSVDGFIAGPQSDISKFPQESEAADDYSERLKTYSSAIMGRATYEFGYAFGLQPGDNLYPHMETLVFSRRIDLPRNARVEVVRNECPYARRGFIWSQTVKRESTLDKPRWPPVPRRGLRRGWSEPPPWTRQKYRSPG